MTALERVTNRRPLPEHDGRSGARIERGVLSGVPVYVKQAALDRDLAQLLTGDGRRELALFESGVFNDLPAGVASALVAVEVVDGTLVTISRDLGPSVLSWDRQLSPDEVCRVFARMAAIHERFADRFVPRLCPLNVRLALFSDDNVGAITAANAELAAAVRRGQELFDEIVPADVSAAVLRNRADPAPLATAMAKAGTTLLHGDCWLVNLAIEGDVLIPMDWGLATNGPPVLDFMTFCVGATSNVTMAREDLLDLARASCGAFANDDVFALGEFWTLMELGWNKALDAVDHADPAKRATERADLDFWVGRARVALDAGLVP